MRSCDYRFIIYPDSEPMADSEPQPPPVKAIPMVAGGLIASSLLITGFFAVQTDWEIVDTRVPLLVLMAAVFGMAMCAVAVVFSSFVANTTTLNPGMDRGRTAAAGLLLTSTIIRFAIFEGVCLLNGIVFFLHHSAVSIFMCVFCILLMIVMWPRKSWIRRRIDEIAS